MSDEGAQHTSTPSAVARSRGVLWELLRLHGLAFLAVTLLAGMTGSSILTGLALFFLACVVSRMCIWRAVTTDHSPFASHGVYAWSYGAGCLLFAVVAGAGFAVAALADAADMPELNWPLDVLVPAAWCAGELWWLRKQAGRTSGANPTTSLLPWDHGFQPIHATLGIERFGLIAATGAAAVGVLLSRASGADLVELGCTAVVALVALFVAVQFALEMRQLLSGVPIDTELLRTLTASIGLAAGKTGAVRTVHSVEAIHTGPGTVLAIVQLEFKDGVAAQHLAPVLAALRAAAIAEVPQITDVLLAPRPGTPDKGSN